MLKHSICYALAASMSTAIVSATLSTNGTTNATDPNVLGYCYDVVDLYQNQNASNTYLIPAITQPLNSSTNSSTASLTNNSTQNWEVRNILGQAPYFYNGNRPLQWESTIYLDPLEDGPTALPIPPTLATCKFIFTLPTSFDGKAPENGDCSSLLSQHCVDDIQSSARALSQSIAATTTMTLEKACDSLGQRLSTLPKSCPKRTGSDSFHILEWGGHNLISESNNTECPNGLSHVPIQIAENNEPLQQGNYSTYDAWLKQTTPVLLAFFTNGTLFTGTPFADTRLLCTSPKNIAPDSYHPTSAAEPATKADTKLLVGVALVMNAILFFML